MMSTVHNLTESYNDVYESIRNAILLLNPLLPLESAGIASQFILYNNNNIAMQLYRTRLSQRREKEKKPKIHRYKTAISRPNYSPLPLRPPRLYLYLHPNPNLNPNPNHIPSPSNSSYFSTSISSFSASLPPRLSTSKLFSISMRTGPSLILQWLGLISQLYI